MAVLAKHLIFNKLQKESFLLAKCAVLQVKTGRIAVRNGTYGNSRRQKLFFRGQSEKLVAILAIIV